MPAVKKVSMKTLAIITHNMSFGGVQRVVKNHIEYFKDNYKITLILFEKKIDFKLPEEIEIIFLDERVFDYKKLIQENKNTIVSFGKELFDFRVNSLVSILKDKQFDTIISHEDYNNLITTKTVELLNYKTNLILTSHIQQDSYKRNLIHLLDADFYYQSIPIYYRNYKIITVSKGVHDYFYNNYNLETYCIENGVNIKEARKQAEEECQEKNFILCIGRIEFVQKGQDDLLKAFKLISKETDVPLLFIGDGKDKEKLEKMILEFNLMNQVKILTFEKNPFKYMKNARVVAFPSYYEGLPNTILESLAVSAALVSYDFEPSSNELSKDGYYFPLVKRGDIHTLGSKLLEVITNNSLEEKMRLLSFERAMDYSLDNMLNKWNIVIEK